MNLGQPSRHPYPGQSREAEERKPGLPVSLALIREIEVPPCLKESPEEEEDSAFSLGDVGSPQETGIVHQR